MSWDLSCRDWEARLASGRSLVPALLLDLVEAERAVSVYNALKLPDVVGTPTLGEASGEWFRDIVRALFGSVIDGERLIRELFLLVPKKNSKTTNGAALILTAALLSRRPRAEFFFVGPTQTIADQGFGQVLGMVTEDPQLLRRVHIQEHLKRITLLATGVRINVKTFDENILTGSKPSGGILVDEVHLLGKMPKADKVLRQLVGGMLPFPEAFIAWITTQSEEAPAGAFRSALMKARAIRDGRLQAPMLPVLYEFPERVLRSDEWRDDKLWSQVNPNCGRSITIKRLAEDYADAVAKGEKDLRSWASQHLNVEIGVALRSDRWEGTDFWQRCADTGVTLATIKARCDVVVVGIDGGGLDDLLGLALIGRDRETRDWLHFAHAWAHDSVLERRKDIVSNLRDFAAEGSLTIYEEPGEDVEAIADIVAGLEELGLLPEKKAIGVDQVAIIEIVDALDARGVTVDSERIVAIAQNWTLSNTIKTTARRLAAGTFRHAGTLMMNWCVGNAKVEPRGNAVTITKQIAGSAKIDPLMATFNAVALMARNPEAAQPSVYSDLAAEDAAAAQAIVERSTYDRARERYAERFFDDD